MPTSARYQKKIVLLALSFTVLFLVSSTVNHNLDQFPYDSETYFPLIKNMTPALGSEDYVDSDISDIDISPDIGTHSSFANQQAGPDSTYDTLTEANGAPLPTNTEDDIDSDTSNVDSTPDVGIEGTFANAQGTSLDSSYFALNEESIISAYGGETGGVFVTGSVPDMAGRDQYCLYQAIFWNPTDDVYEVTRVEFSYTGSTWLNAIQQGSGLSFPTSGWSITSKQVAFWTSATPITVQPHTASSFYVRGDSNKIRAEYYIDIGITANSSTYTETYHSAQNRNRPAAQLWLGAASPPTQIHSVSTGVQSIVYVSLEEDTGLIDILSGGTLTIDVPTGFTGITSVGGTNWGSATINGNQITVSNTATIRGTYLTYGFQITSPSTPGLYKLDVAFDDGLNAYPIGNFTVHVTGVPPTVEKINLEYQWSTAAFDETYEEVCIYVGSLTGSEDLVVNYWDEFTWNTLGTISTTGWTNFTATSLSSSTYTIQLLGTSETSDSSKDTWNIDLITLHTWSLQTYNYKLDLEIQWSSANYTQDFEELCIYAGSLAPESIRIDIWTGAVWTNIATDLNEDSWNNISIGTWLLSATLTIRFRGDLEVGDTSQSSWEIDCSLLHTWDNEVPTNSATPVISNLDDTTFLYAEYRQYQLTAEVTDLDGYAEIDYVELTLTSDDQLTEYWSVRFDEDTNLFTEQSDPSNSITLDNVSSSAVKAGTTISATFFITINWDHPDVVNTDMKSEVYDADPSSSSDYFEVNWDIETRLDLSSGPTLNDGSGTSTRGDLDGSMTASGAITYLGSALHPSSGAVDVWISSSEYGTQIGPWESTNYEDAGGTFSATVYADNQVGLDDYTFKAVTEGAGAASSDHFSVSQTAQYITDRVQVQSYFSDDSRINVNTTASLHVVLYYDYDNSYVTDGTVTINGLTATYSGSNGIWDFTDEQSTTQSVTYNTLAYSGGTHGITGEDQNGQSLDQIWDYVTVVSYSVVDARVDVNANAIIDVTLIYEYDGSSVLDGSVTINGASATHQGVGVWRITVSNASVQGITYNLVVASGNTHDVTLVDQNSQSQLVVWDRVIVIGYSVVDNHVNVDDSVNLDVTLEYEYDSAPVTDGTVTINLVSASHTGGGVWRITVSKSTVKDVTYDTVACSGNTFGISVVNQNSESQLIIWDQIIVITYSVADSRVNIDDSVNIDVTIEYAYDNSRVTTGSVSINAISATHQGSGVWRISDTKASVQSFTYNLVTCSGNTHGITSVNQDSQSQDVIWDQITVRSYTVLDGRVNLDDSVNIDVLLEYEYDDTAVTDGSVTINTISATPVGSGIWRITESKSTVQSITYDTVVCSGNSYGITSVNPNSQSTEVIWDQVVVLSYSVRDARIDISTAITINFTLEYESDNAPVTLGVVTVNGISASHVSGGVWEITQSRSTVQNVTYNNVQCSGNFHGIDTVDQNSQSIDIIWDQITVRGYEVSDPRDNVGDSIVVTVELEYEFDDSDVTDGTITINSVSFTYTGSLGKWSATRMQAIVTDETYDTVSSSGNTYGITNVNQNGQSQTIIWDRIQVVTTTVDDGRINIDTSCEIRVTLMLEYDSTPLGIGDAVTLDGVAMVWDGTDSRFELARQQSTVGDWLYYVNASVESTYGISALNVNSQEVSVIWDQIRILTTVVDDGRVSIDSNAELRVTAELAYDGHVLGTGDTVTLDGVAMVWDGTDSRFELARQQSTVGDWLYYVNASIETTYGISALNVNSQEVSVIWDQIRILTTVVDDGRVSIDSNAELRVTAVLAYDGHVLGTGDTITMDSASMNWDGTNSWFDLSRMKSSVGLWNFQVESASEATYGITAIDLNGQSQDVIWDQLSINIVADMDSVPNSIQVNFTMTVTFAYDLATCTTYSIVISRNGTYWHTFTNVNVTDFYDTNSDIAYEFSATAANSESTYGITVFFTNIETVEWGAGTAAPANNAPPVLTNPDDTDSMYARLRFYLITSNVSDAQGFADIVYVELSLWDDSRSTEIWRIRYNQSTDTFSVVVGSEYIQLSGSSYLKSGLSIDIIWSIKIDWDHQDLSNVDFKQYVVDGNSEFDENWYEVDYDVETQLDYSTAPSLSDDRGDLGTSDLECSGTVVYYGSLIHPLANETDVWISNDASDTWFGNVDASGDFIVLNIGSSSFVQLNNYTIKIVAQNNGSSGLDLYHTDSVIDRFITDQIEFYLSGVPSDRVNVDDGGTVWWNARYDYDNTEITGGLIALLNGSKTLLWDSGNSRWYHVESSSVVTQIGYTILSGSESGYDLTGWVQTASDVSVIWDMVIVRLYSVVDTRTNVSDSVDIDVLLEYEFDDSFVTNGAVLINAVSASYQGSGIWRITESRSSVVSVVYDTVSCSGNAHSISNVDQNTQSVTVIWDRIIVDSYSVTDPRVNINDDVNIDVTLTYEFDSAFVLDGSVFIEGVSATPQGLGVWRITQTRSSVQSVTFNSVSCSGNTHGIAVVNQNSQSQGVIWDQVVVQSYTVLDNRINVDDSANIDFVLHYGYDGSDVTDGLVSINGISATYQVSGIWRIVDTRSSVQLVDYDTVVCSGNFYGISSVNQNSQSDSIIWDEIVVRSYSVIDYRVDLDTVVFINVTLEYEYNDSSVVDGVVIIQSISSKYIGNGIWQINMSKSSVQNVTFNIVVCSGNTHDISSVNQNGQSTDIIWDKIIVRSYTVTDSRVNVDDSVNIDVLIQYEYDDSPVILGPVTINGASAIHQGAGVWRISATENTVQTVTYNLVISTGNLYDISTMDQNAQSLSVIWDQVVVLSYQVLDTRVDTGDSVNVDVVLEFAYDNTDVTNGSVSINGNSASYQGGGVWRISVVESVVTLNTYDIVICSGNDYDITSIDPNGQSIDIVWDQITVRSLTASDERDNIGSTITVYLSLEYEHDDSTVSDGSVLVNSIPFTYNISSGFWFTNRLQNSVTFEDYDLTVVSGNDFDISVVNQNGLSLRIIWDRIRILTTTVDDSRLNTDATATIMVTAELEYDSQLLGLGDTLVLGGSAMTWDDGNGWFYFEVTHSAVGLWSYYVNTTGALESFYDISQVTVAGQSQDVVWDQLSITITPDETSVNDYDSVSFTLIVVYSYDSSLCTTYILDISRNSTYWLTSFDSEFVDDDENIALTYNYSILAVAGESSFGITDFISNTVEVTWSTPTNFDPYNNGAPTLQNPDNSNTMYSRLRFYFITSSFVDYDGFADVDYVELSLWDNNRYFVVWRVRYTTASQSFSIIVGSEYIQLSLSSSNFSAGYLLNVTWSIKIDWDHIDLQNIDMRQYIIDSEAAFADDWYESNWGVETRLYYNKIPSLSDDHGDVDTIDLQASGNVTYYGSSDVYPLANETDVWVIHDFSGSWSGDVNALGVLSVSGIGSSSIVRENIYTFKIVAAGLGHGSADLFYSTSPTDTFITDRIVFYDSGVVDSRININSLCDVWWSARYQFDNSDIQSGLTAYLNGIHLLTWDSAFGRWHFQEARSSSINRSYTISSAIDTGSDITSWVQNATDRAVIWDSLIISITDPFDQRTNVNTNATGIRVSAKYSYDLTQFDGTILLDNTTFQFSSVHRQYYTVASAFGDTHGINVISINDQTWCIWDQIEVVSIASNVTYLDPNEYARVQVFLLYDFDDAPVTDGNFSLKFVDLVHLADGIWEVNVTRLSYQMIHFDTLTTCEATVFGITNFDLYGNDLAVYWDRLEFYESSAADSRIDVGSTGFSLWSVRLENAGIDIMSGITAQATGDLALTYVNDYWRSSHTSDVVGDQTFSILSASLEGIDFFTISTNDVTIIWDRIQVLTTSASSTNPAIEQFIIVTATLSYEYDGTEVTDGVVTLWDQESQITMTYNVSGGFWYANITKVEIGNYTFYIEAVSGNQYGITGVSLNGNQITIEFVPAPLPRLTPMMIAGIGTGFIAFVLISAILVRRRYYVEIPYEIKQINAILEAMEKEEKIEAIDIKPAEQSVLDLLEPGLIELGLTMQEILESIDDAELEEIHVPAYVSEPDAEIAEALEDFVMPEPDEEIVEPEEEVVSREIPESESTGEFEELDVEAYTDLEAAAEEALTLMLDEVRKVKAKAGIKVPVTKDDWIEKLPTSVKSMFFEEELKELEIPDIEVLAQLSPEEVESLLDTVAEAKKTDVINPEESYIEIVDALKIKFDEIEEEEELDEAAQKKRTIRSLPGFVIEHFSEAWLENLSQDELKELTQLTEEELKTVIDSLKEATEPAKSEQLEEGDDLDLEEDVEDIDFEEEIRKLDLKEEVEDLPVEEMEVADFDVEEKDVEEIDVEAEAEKLDSEEEVEDLEAKDEKGE